MIMCKDCIYCYEDWGSYGDYDNVILRCKMRDGDQVFCDSGCENFIKKVNEEEKRGCGGPW